GQLGERLKPVAIVYSFRCRHCPFRRAERKKTFAAPFMQKLQDASSHHGIFHRVNMLRRAKLNNSSSNRRHRAPVTQIRTCLALLAISHFIDSSLQRGGWPSLVPSLTKTAEVVEALSGAVNTQLKQGVNER